MKRIYLGCLVLAVAICCFSVASTYAQASDLSDAHIARIKANCISAQSSINRLHTSDTLLRVNRGQLYEQLSNKAMAPFNSRIALNHMDSLSLVSIAANYEQQLDVFREAYQEYENTTSKALAMNCVKQPAEFYHTIAEARARRQAVHQATQVLERHIQQYRDEVTMFANNLMKQGIN